MAIIRISTDTLNAHKQIPTVLRHEFPDLELVRPNPFPKFETFRTAISRDKYLIPIFHYVGPELKLKALI